MKVAIDTSSTQAGSQFRGIGFYTARLCSAYKTLEQEMGEVSVIEFNETIPDADLYHFPAFQPFFFSFPLSLISQSVVTIHDLIPLEYPRHFPPGIKGSLRWQIQKYLLRYARHIITDSFASKKTIIRLAGVDPEKVSVVYLAADPIFQPVQDQIRLQSVKEKYHLPDQFVLYVGDMNWNKNVVALAKGCIQCNRPFVVVGKQAVAGDIDPLHPWNTELVQFQELADQHPNQILRTGFVETEELVALYNLATVLVQPAIAEGFGLPVLEAFSCGCPVIISNRSSLPEIAQEAAIQVDATNQTEIEDGINTVFNDTDVRKNLSQQGLKRAQSFSWNKTACQTLEIYKSCLK